MFRVIHVSSASIPLSAQDLRRLLEEARRTNEAAEITGMLLHCQGQFLQALEGPAAAVRQTFARIEQDTRHRDIVQLQRGDAGRLFSKWTMGFSDFHGRAATPGVVRINERLNLRRLDALAVIDLLTASAAAQD